MVREECAVLLQSPVFVRVTCILARFDFRLIHQQSVTEACNASLLRAANTTA